MSRILIAGASGLIYRELVRQLPAEHQLTLLCRKPGQPQPARHWLPVNFDMLAEVNLPEPVDLAFCCLGTTRKEAGSVGPFAGSISTMCWPLPSWPAATPASDWWWSRAWGQPALPCPLSPHQGEMEQALLASPGYDSLSCAPPCCWEIVSRRAARSSFSRPSTRC